MATFVIGDVHGCFYTLKHLIAKLPPTSKLIFVGDLVDKGNFPKKTVQFVMENNHACIMGNHEYLMIKYIEDVLKGKKTVEWGTNQDFGGYKTIEDYRHDIPTLTQHLEWMRKLPRYIEIEHYFITHAFALPYYKRRALPTSHRALMSNRPSDAQIWGWDWEESYEHYNIINIYGHDIVDRIDTTKQCIGIDTGCVYGNALTAIALDDLALYTEPVDKRDIEKSYN